MRIENEMLSRFNTEALWSIILKKKLEYKVRLKNIHFTFRGGLNKTVFLLFWRRR